jgi:hypothetical protein
VENDQACFVEWDKASVFPLSRYSGGGSGWGQTIKLDAGQLKNSQALRIERPFAERKATINHALLFLSIQQVVQFVIKRVGIGRALFDLVDAQLFGDGRINRFRLPAGVVSLGGRVR